MLGSRRTELEVLGAGLVERGDVAAVVAFSLNGSTPTFAQYSRYSFRVRFCTSELLRERAVSTTAAVEATGTYVLAEGARLNHATLRAALVRPSCKPESRDEPRSTKDADDILLTADVDARACLPDESVRAARVHAAARGYDRHNQDTSHHDVGA